MSAVENVDARIARLQQSLDAKCAELRALQPYQRYNTDLGVDEDIATGRSVAVLDVQVGGARNVQFSTGFLSGKTTYVRAWLEPRSTHTEALQCTRKIDIATAPQWHESFSFRSVAHIGAVLVVELMQDERIGKDLLVGLLQLPLALLQDQRVNVSWHPLTRENQPIGSDVQLSCRFRRSHLSALEHERLLLQNQLRELHSFAERQRLFSPRTTATATRNDHFAPRNPLIGKEVTLPATSSNERSTSRRFDAVATFPARAPAAPLHPHQYTNPHFVAARKREHVEFAPATPADAATIDAVEAGDGHRSKRQRITTAGASSSQASAHAPTVSFSHKLANWLLPSSSHAKHNPTPSAASNPFASTAAPATSSSTNFIFKQPLHSGLTASERRRAKKPVGSSSGGSSRQKQKLSVRQSFEQWLFTEPENTAPN